MLRNNSSNQGDETLAIARDDLRCDLSAAATRSQEFSVRLRDANLMVVGSSPVVVVCSGSQEEGGVHRKTAKTTQTNESVILTCIFFLLPIV